MYVAELAALTDAIIAYRHAEAPAPGGGKTKSRNLIAATCGCPRKIRVARTTLDEAPIVCGACGQPFEPA